MPAINPAVLNSQIEALFADSIDAEQFAREAYALLDFYADRTKRSTALTGSLEAAEKMHVPEPVLKVFSTKIARRGYQPGDEWLAAAQRLWDLGLQEPRLVSVMMLGEAPLEQAFTNAVSWAAECDDELVLRSLASDGLKAWLQSEQDRILDLSSEWLVSESMRPFGMMVLHYSIEAELLLNLAKVFELLAGFTGSVRGLEADALRGLLRYLAKHAPAETTAYLLDELASQNHSGIRLIRNLVEVFPSTFQTEIRQALR